MLPKMHYCAPKSSMTTHLLTLAIAAIALNGCSTSAYGIPLAPERAPADLQELARHAQGGDKHAALELGIRYEEGRGVPMDVRQAIRLYRQAAMTSGGSR